MSDKLTNDALLEELNAEELDDVSGGGDINPSKASEEYREALTQLNGKKCKSCNHVFDMDEMLKSMRLPFSLQAMNFAHGRKQVWCVGCGLYRSILADFE